MIESSSPVMMILKYFFEPYKKKLTSFLQAVL